MISSAVNPNLALCLWIFYECRPSHDPSSPDDFPWSFRHVEIMLKQVREQNSC